MHTFFINTSEKVSEKLKENIYQDILFEELIANRSLIITEPYVSMDPECLKKCAEGIAKQIDQEADIREDIALVVYMETDHLRSVSSGPFVAYTIAYEMLRCMQVEKSLVWTLCDLGKKPGKLYFVYGEHVLRDPTLVNDSVFLNDIKQYLWEILRLPLSGEMLNFMTRKKAPSREELKIFFEDFYRNTAASVNEIGQTAEKFMNGEICEKLIIEFLERLDAIRKKPFEGQLYACLDDVINEYTRSFLRDRRRGRYPGWVQYNFLTLESNDIHEIDRSICRLMLYLYAVAYNGNCPQGSRIDLPDNENSIINAFCLPTVNYTVFKQELYKYAAYCYDSTYKPSMPPAVLKKTVEDQHEIIQSVHEPPKLLPENLFEYAGGPKLDFEKSVGLRGRFVSLSTLRSAVDNILTIARQTNDTNQERIIEYLNRITSEYDRIKDDALKNLPLREDLPVISDAGGDDAEKGIDDLKNISDKAGKILSDRELQLLKSPLEMIKTDNVLELINKTKEQTDYYFDGLYHRLNFITGGFAFVLAVLIPYYFLRQNIFSLPQGNLFFLGTGAAVLASLVIGRLIFVAKYKDIIVSMMERFIAAFKVTQRNNSKFLNEYRTLLYQDIPGYYSICQYMTYLDEYREQTLKRREKITYHDKSRENRIKKISSLLDDLDRGSGAELYLKIKSLIGKNKREIDPEGDRIANKSVYILSYRDVRDVLMRSDDMDNTEK